MQVETPLELASGLSLSLDNRLFLKREDLQPVAHSTILLSSFLAPIANVCHDTSSAVSTVSSPDGLRIDSSFSAP